MPKYSLEETRIDVTSGLDFPPWDKASTTLANSPLSHRTSDKLAGTLVLSLHLPLQLNLLISLYGLNNLST